MPLEDRRSSQLRSGSVAGLLGLVLTASLALQPQVSSAQKAPAAKPPAKVDSAEALYKQHCQFCHLDGNSPISELNFANGKWKHGSGVSHIVKIVRDGAPGTAMLGFKDKLTEKEIRALAEYVRAFDKSLKPEKPKKSKKSVKPPG